MLGIWMYFWDEAEWTGAPPAPTPVPAPVADEPRGSGKGRGQFIWDTAGPDYWDVREQFLRRNFPEPEPAPTPKQRKEAPKPKDNVEADYRNAYLKAQTALTKRQFEMQFLKLQELASQIESLRAQYEEDAILLLLLNL